MESQGIEAIEQTPSEGAGLLRYNILARPTRRNQIFENASKLSAISRGRHGCWKIADLRTQKICENAPQARKVDEALVILKPLYEIWKENPSPIRDRRGDGRVLLATVMKRREALFVAPTMRENNPWEIKNEPASSSV